MNQGPDISAFVLIAVLSVIGVIALILGLLAGVDALFTHLRWLP